MRSHLNNKASTADYRMTSATGAETAKRENQKILKSMEKSVKNLVR